MQSMRDYILPNERLQNNQITIINNIRIYKMKRFIHSIDEKYKELKPKFNKDFFKNLKRNY